MLCSLVAGSADDVNRRQSTRPFGYLGTFGALKEWYCREWRDDGLSWLHGRLVLETVCKITVGMGDANLKEQVCSSF